MGHAAKKEVVGVCAHEHTVCLLTYTCVCTHVCVDL